MVIQVIATLDFGDAMGNDALILKKILKENGYETEIFANNISPKLIDKARHICKLPKITKNDVLIYHFGISDNKILKIIKNISCKKVLYYHNITPAQFFINYSISSWEKCLLAREELVEMKNIFDYCWSASSYSKKELLDVGYKCPLAVLPILIDYNDYNQHLGEEVLKKYGDDDWVNIIFVGRIAPNKKQEDIIKIFAYYKKYINSKSRLILVGNHEGMEQYYYKLNNYIKLLDIEDVIFTGRISFNDILAYYNIADIFLCMTEHEGFCVPLIEAMYFDVPIVAFESTAVTETLGGAGVSINTKDEAEVAGMIDYILSHQGIKNRIVKSQQKRLIDFSYEKVKSKFLELLDLMKGSKNE